MFGSIIKKGFDSYELEQVARAYNEPSMLTAQDCKAIEEACKKADEKAKNTLSVVTR